jgi:hypothetical protein
MSATDINGIHPVTAEILRREGKPYIWTPVPKGLPRYRTIGDCHANSARAVLEDERLFYVEGAARHQEGWWVEHAWVTLDHVHAIDLTWRGQSTLGSRRHKEAIHRFGADAANHTKRTKPADEYIGIEIPRQEVAELVVRNEYYGLILRQWAREHVESVKAFYAGLPIKSESVPLVFGERAHVGPRSRPRRVVRH